MLGIVVAWGAAKCKVTRERSPRDHCTHFAEWRVARREKIETAAGPFQARQREVSVRHIDADGAKSGCIKGAGRR